MFGGANDAADDTAGAMQNTPVPAMPGADEQTPAEAVSAPSTEDHTMTAADAPAPGYDPTALADATAAAPAASSAGAAGDDADDLLAIKQQALQQLSPLVGHLDQSPEEKFRTTMMMIQASDNQALIKDAYAAAGQITDEKTRAQALLDIVNEINYFTQHPAQPNQ